MSSHKVKSLTDALRAALSAQSIYRTWMDVGLDRRALSRFLSGRQSLRLDLADKLAAYFGIEVHMPAPARRRRKGG